MAASAFAQRAPETALRDLAQRASTAQHYAFEGNLLVTRQRGMLQPRVLTAARVSLTVGPAGRLRLRIAAQGQNEYLIVSDGRRTWTYVPSLQQYTSIEMGAAVGGGPEEGGAEDDDRTVAFTRRILPTLIQVCQNAAEVHSAGAAKMRYAGKKVTWPVVRLESAPDPQGAIASTEIAFDPESLTVGRFIWTHTRPERNQASVMKLTMAFDSYQLGGPLADSAFLFEPPAGSSLVDTVPMPGRPGSPLIRSAAPDFELRTLEGETVRLSALRGKPVMLNFTAGWCPPCRMEAPTVVKLNDEYGQSGLLVFAVDYEEQPRARQFVTDMGFTFPLLEDAGAAVHKLYRVEMLPTVVLIDKDGKIARFLQGVHDYASLSAALKPLL